MLTIFYGNLMEVVLFERRPIYGKPIRCLRVAGRKSDSCSPISTPFL